MRAQCGAAAAEPSEPSDPPAKGLPTHRDAATHRRITSFRTRRSTLSSVQQRTWQRLWAVYGLDAPHFGDADGKTAAETPNTDAWFGRVAPVVLEIGCGAGTSTLAMAQTEPDVNVVAVDVYRRGLAQLLCALEREDVANVRLIRGDAVDVLEHLIPSGSLTGVRIFFPDPWPKTRHHKRRLLQPSTMNLIATRLRSGGVVHVATDHAGYADHIAATGDGEPRLRRLDPDRQPVISVTRPTTKYETKARQAGSIVTELLWEKCGP